MKTYALPIRYGLATSGSLIAYFLILSLFELHVNIFYSLFNGVITGIGIYEAIRAFRLQQGDAYNYGKGFVAGMVTGVTATLAFTLFFAFYSTEISLDFLPRLTAVFFNDLRDFEGIIFLTVAIMGIATSLVLTLAFMQLFKGSKKTD